MKQRVLFVNSSRGHVVDEAALIHALAKGQIAGAALDVLEQEPPCSDNPLFNFPNVIVTPQVTRRLLCVLLARHVEAIRRIGYRFGAGAVASFVRKSAGTSAMEPEPSGGACWSSSIDQTSKRVESLTSGFFKATVRFGVGASTMRYQEPASLYGPLQSSR